MPDDARVVELCERLDAILTGPARGEVVDDAASAPTLGAALARLAGKLRVNAWPTADGIVHIEALVQSLDRATRAEGFHALHDWDGIAARVNPDTIAVDVLSFVAGRRGADPVDRAAVAIVLDYHFLNLLALASLRVWDTSDPNAALDRLQVLLDYLQTGGSGQRFAADAATLLLIATSLLLLPLFEVEAVRPGGTFYSDRIFGALATQLRASSWVPALVALGFATGFVHYLLDRSVYRLSDARVRAAARGLLSPPSPRLAGVPLARRGSDRGFGAFVTRSYRRQAPEFAPPS